ncbi:MAG: hypothetical protein ACFCBW_00170 [Candidatus Competibacterales bacterium]
MVVAVVVAVVSAVVGSGLVMGFFAIFVLVVAVVGVASEKSGDKEESRPNGENFRYVFYDGVHSSRYLGQN